MSNLLETFVLELQKTVAKIETRTTIIEKDVQALQLQLSVIKADIDDLEGESSSRAAVLREQVAVVEQGVARILGRLEAHHNDINFNVHNNSKLDTQNILTENHELKRT